MQTGLANRFSEDTGENRRCQYPSLYDPGPMLQTLRQMPGGLRLFLVYAFLILAGIGLSLRFVVDQAIENARREGRMTVLDRDVPEV